MAGIVHQVSPRVLYDFSQVGISASQDVVVAKAIPCLNWREATLLVRYHAGGTVSSGQSVNVRVRSEAPADDEPNSDFVYVTDLAVATINSTTASPGLLLQAISLVSNQHFGSRLRVFVRGTQSGGGGTLKAYLSIDISFKSS